MHNIIAEILLPFVEGNLPTHYQSNPAAIFYNFRRYLDSILTFLQSLIAYYKTVNESGASRLRNTFNTSNFSICISLYVYILLL